MPAMRKNQLAHQATKPRSTTGRQPTPRVESVTSRDAATARSKRRDSSSRERSVAHDHVGFQIEQQRQRVDVGAAHRGPLVVDQRHLGVQERRRVLEDADAVGPQLVVQHLRRQGGEAVVDLALQQQAHPNAALGGADQRAPEQAPRIEVRRHQVDAVARAQDRLDVGALDRTSPAQVVAHEEGHAHRRRDVCDVAAGGDGATRRRRCSTRRARASGCALRASATISSRQSAGNAARLHTARAACATLAATGPRSSTAKSSRGASRRAVTQVDAVVDDVDAADESHLAVDRAQLVVQAAQLARLQQAPPAIDRPEHHQLDVGLRHPFAQPRAAWPWSRSRRPPRSTRTPRRPASASVVAIARAASSS